uniref:FBA_2 domain-containing protein n=1 Tax=Steinernema glaseri TaxID=37863 RepID=A0A1I8ARH4_9BILA
MLSLASRHFTCEQHLSLIHDFAPPFQSGQLPISQSIPDCGNIREVLVQYSSEASTEFMLHLLTYRNVEVLRLAGKWPVSSLHLLLDKWAESGVRDVCVESSITERTFMNADLMEHIYKLWVDGFFAMRRLQGSQEVSKTARGDQAPTSQAAGFFLVNYC